MTSTLANDSADHKRDTLKKGMCKLPVSVEDEGWALWEALGLILAPGKSCVKSVLPASASKLLSAFLLFNLPPLSTPCHLFLT